MSSEVFFQKSEKMISKLVLTAFFTIGMLAVNARNNKNIEISIIPSWGTEQLSLNKIYQGLNGSKFKLNTLKFYICHINMTKSSKVVYKEKNSYHLVDLSNETSLSWILNNGAKKDFDKINFQLGVDSLTNESGVRGSDLDPTKGMYWSWQSGYINFKMEGDFKLKEEVSNFEYHLGGYQGQFNAIQTINLNAVKSKVIRIRFDVQEFVSNVNFSLNSKIMSPSLRSKKLAMLVAKCFHIIYV